MDESTSFQDVYNQILRFQKIFVINLPHRFDHRDSLSLAARLTDLDIEYVDGVQIDMDAKRYLPPMPDDLQLTSGAVGAYIAHMDVLRKIIEENITTLLVLEGDVDWDVRIKSQMHTFARASRILLEPGQEDRHWDVEKSFLSRSNLSSPYGDIDRWDLSWLGHRGADFPPNEGNVPSGRVEIRDDITVPEQQHIEVPWGSKAVLEEYPSHTRVALRVWGKVCSLAYGITQNGARELFYELAIRKSTEPAGLMIRSMCGDHGMNPHERPTETCLTVQPQLFQHHRPAAPKNTFSDIDSHGDYYNHLAFTRNIRWSTHVNFANLVRGDANYLDQFEDGAPAGDFEPDVHED